MQNELLTNFEGTWIPSTSVLPQDDAYVLVYIKRPESNPDPEMEEIILTAHVFEERWIDSMSGEEINKPMKDIWWRPFPNIKEIKQEPTK